MSKELVSKDKQDKFRDNIKLKLIENADMFWNNLRQLKPREFCDIYLKAMQYGFAKVPDEKPMDEETQRKLVLEETQRKVSIITNGLPSTTEDVDYEDE